MIPRDLAELVKRVSTPRLEFAAWALQAFPEMAHWRRAIEQELLSRQIAEDEGANAAGGAA